MCHRLLKTTNHIHLTLKSRQRDVFGNYIPKLHDCISLRQKAHVILREFSNTTSTQTVRAQWPHG